MKKIRIEGIEGYYYVEDDCLYHSCNDLWQDDIEVSDLCDLTISQYNKLVDELYVHYNDYKIDYLEGRFI